MYLTYFYIKYISSEIPGPLPYPFIGNILDFYEGDLSIDKRQHVKNYYNKYGSTWRLYLPGIFLQKCIYISNPEDIEYILKTQFNYFEKGNIQYNIFKDLLGDGIFNSDGSIWKQHRKIASYNFSQSNLKNYMYTIFLKHSDIYINKFKNTNSKIDIQKHLFNFTMDSIIEIGLGINPNKIYLSEEFSKSFDNIQSICEKRFYIPYWKILKYFKIGIEKNSDKYLQIVDKYINTIIAERLDNPIDNQNDILSKFMIYSKNKVYLRNVITNFIIAGRDTTATALTWCIYVIAKNKDIYNKLRQEILNTPLTHKNLKSMKYLHGFINEILRLYPPIPIDTKVCTNDTCLPSGFNIFKNDRIFYCPIMTGQLSEVWDEPDKIIPERWFNNNKSAYEFPVFNGGYRLCLGKSMAYMEIGIFLYKLIKQFDIKLISKDIVHTTKITLNIKENLYIELCNKI